MKVELLVKNSKVKDRIDPNEQKNTDQYDEKGSVHYIKITLFNVIAQNKLLSVFRPVPLFLQKIQVAPVPGKADSSFLH